jgi:hypothetical protein
VSTTRPLQPFDLHEDAQQVIEEIATMLAATFSLSVPASSFPSQLSESEPLASDGRYEILVAREHHHDDEAADQRDVDHGQHGQHQVGLFHFEQVVEDVPDLLE